MNITMSGPLHAIMYILASLDTESVLNICAMTCTLVIKQERVY